MRRIEDAILLLALAAIMITALSLMMRTAHSTGPWCPGMDPEWIGWCQSPDQN